MKFILLLSALLLSAAPAMAQGESHAGSSMTVGGHGLYEVVVPYALDFDKQIAAAMFERTVDPTITIDRFADDPGCDQDLERRFILVHLDRLATSSQAERSIPKGFKAATLLELVAFAANYPDFQRDFPIVALGRKWKHPDGVARYGYIHEKKGRRVLDLERGDRRWVMNVRFLAVRESR